MLEWFKPQAPPRFENTSEKWKLFQCWMGLNHTPHIDLKSFSPKTEIAPMLDGFEPEAPPRFENTSQKRKLFQMSHGFEARAPFQFNRFFLKSGNRPNVGWVWAQSPTKI